MTAFYAPLQGGAGRVGAEDVHEASYRPTSATQGPWSPQTQHGGPPGALILREMERLAPAAGGHLARLAVDFLAPVPVAPLTVRTTVVKPGRRARLFAAEVAAEGRTVLTARGWWRRQVPGLVPEVPDGLSAARPFPEPDSLETASADGGPAGVPDHGWMNAMEFRYVLGGPTVPGPCRVWVRPRLPLVEGEELSPTQCAVLVADGASGLGSALDFRTHLFSNLDLNLSFLRAPEGDWVSVDAASAIDAAGGGSTVTRLGDRRGVHGYVQQTLYVEPHGRGPA
jgi:acyl-coenzyme A thioesterase PaaI-like protein